MLSFRVLSGGRLGQVEAQHLPQADQGVEQVRFASPSLGFQGLGVRARGPQACMMHAGAGPVPSLTETITTRPANFTECTRGPSLCTRVVCCVQLHKSGLLC